MTTIAADLSAGVMCADSYWTDGDECGYVRKVFMVRGELVGFAGGIREWQRWLEAWRASPGKQLPRFSTLTVLRLTHDGIHSWTAPDGWLPVQESKYAIGSGGKCARGAMAAGASCKEAVRIAGTIDAGTGGPVRQYRLRPLR